MKALHLAHILVSHKYEGEDLQRKLAEGTPFSELAQKYSNCPSAKNGGDLGTIELKRLDMDFAEAAETLQPGSTSGLVRTSFGYHLIYRFPS